MSLLYLKIRNGEICKFCGGVHPDHKEGCRLGEILKLFKLNNEIMEALK